MTTPTKMITSRVLASARSHTLTLTHPIPTLLTRSHPTFLPVPPSHRHFTQSHRPLESWTSRLFGSSKPKYAPGEFARDPIITYDELLPLTEQPSDDILLVDVREPDETAQGMIPSAVGLPLSQMKEALDKGGEGDFYKKFSYPKPLPAQNIIFYCRSGKRSAAAAELAAERGYKNVRNYRGSWLDWTRRTRGRGSEEEDDVGDDGVARN